MSYLILSFKGKVNNKGGPNVYFNLTSSRPCRPIHCLFKSRV